MSNYNLTLFELLDATTLTDAQAESIFARLEVRLPLASNVHMFLPGFEWATPLALLPLNVTLDERSGNDALGALLREWGWSSTALNLAVRAINFREFILRLRCTPRTLAALARYARAVAETTNSYHFCCDVQRLMEGMAPTPPALTPAHLRANVKSAPSHDDRTAYTPEELDQVLGDYRLLLNSAQLYDLPGARLDGDTPLWVWREHAKLAQDVYDELPENVAERLDDTGNEVPHLSHRDKGMIAFTENARKGWYNIQSVARPGKYLRRHIKVTDQDLKDLVAAVNSAGVMEVCFATDPDAIREVYLNGPQSCMKYGPDQFDRLYDDFGEWHHPCEVYGHPGNDIELAYVVNSKGEIGARALINTGSRAYPSIYGSDYMPTAFRVLMDWLEANGYEHDEDALRGETLLRIDLRGGLILCPYIDHHNIGVEVYSDHLVAGGDEQACHDEGYIHDETLVTCADCDERVPEDDTTIDWSGDTVCNSCIDDNYVRAIDRHGDIEWIRTEDTIELPCNVTHHGVSIDAVHEDFDDWDEIGIRRLDNGDLVDEDDAIETSDGGWINRSNVIDEGDDPEHYLLPFTTHVDIDGTAYPLGDVFWHLDEDCWCLCEYHDLLAMTRIDEHRYRDTDLLDTAA